LIVSADIAYENPESNIVCGASRHVERRKLRCDLLLIESLSACSTRKCKFSALIKHWQSAFKEQQALIDYFEQLLGRLEALLRLFNYALFNDRAYNLHVWVILEHHRDIVSWSFLIFAGQFETSANHTP